MERLMKLVAATTVVALALPTLADDDGSGHAKDAEEKKLTIADAAPELEIAHWVKGEAIDGFEPDNIYIVEFWATWCGPCLAAMPHVSEVQEKYRDYGVSVVGISDEPLQTVVEFLAREREEGELWYQTIQYTLATDPERRPHTEYMKAAGQRGIPTAFIVGKTGEVEWIGHPMSMDEPLDQIVHDQWDRETFREEFVVRQEREREMMKLMSSLREFRASEDWHGALKTIDAIIELDVAPFYKAERFMMLLRDMNVPMQAYRYGNTVLEEHWDDSNLLNHIAWGVVDDEGVETRDLDFAMKAASRANELTEGENAAILDTLARVYYEKGDLKNAVKYQRKSVEHSEGIWYADDMKETLERYEAELAERD